MGNTNVLLDSKAQEIMKDVYHLGGNSGHKVTIEIGGRLVTKITYLYYVDGVLTTKDITFDGSGLYTLDNVYAFTIDISGGNYILNKDKSTGIFQQIGLVNIGVNTEPIPFSAPLTDIRLCFYEVFE